MERRAELNSASRVRTTRREPGSMSRVVREGVGTDAGPVVTGRSALPTRDRTMEAITFGLRQVDLRWIATAPPREKMTLSRAAMRIFETA